jgi:hypothetical protein
LRYEDCGIEVYFRAFPRILRFKPVFIYFLYTSFYSCLVRRFKEKKGSPETAFRAAPLLAASSAY